MVVGESGQRVAKADCVVKLSGRVRLHGIEAPIIGRVATSPVDACARRETVLMSGDTFDVEGYAAVICVDESVRVRIEPSSDFDYLADGDVVAIDPAGMLRVLYRRQSRHNFLFVTDQCNSYCLMCSQPPKQVDDLWRVAELHRVIDLMDPATATLGFTGGEPTLFGRDFIALIEHCRDRLPSTALHVLTNGRGFARRDFAHALADVRHPNLTLAIPVYSDSRGEHDYVVQAAGAFEETIAGLLNLAELGIEVEIRIVVHRQTYRRLPQLAEFITSNLPFALHVAIMGLEMTGFTLPNMDTLWIDPLDYEPQLKDAVRTIASAGIDVSIYNHPLCVLPRDLWSFARQSISDWKNVYLPQCDACAVRKDCGGLFQSATVRRSRGIVAVT